VEVQAVEISMAPIPESDRGKRLSIEFDGVFRDARVALNGNFSGRNMSGHPTCTGLRTSLRLTEAL
jgi:hypothetical protein